MDIKQLDRVVALLLSTLGVYTIWQGYQYGFMQGAIPGGGFFPVLIGIAIAGLSLANLMRNISGLEKIQKGFGRIELLKSGGVCIALALFILVTPCLGITFATMLLMMAVGLVIRPILEPRFLARLTICSILFPLFCRLAFGQWIGVPLPRGPFGL